MMSKIPIQIDKESNEDINKQVLRVGLIAELDAINLYEQLAAITTDEKIKKVLYDIANEEKTHIGEFQALLLKYDKEQEGELKKGSEEVEEI